MRICDPENRVGFTIQSCSVNPCGRPHMAHVNIRPGKAGSMKSRNAKIGAVKRNEGCLCALCVLNEFSRSNRILTALCRSLQQGRLCALCVKQSHEKVHAEAAKGKPRKDRRDCRFRMSLRALRVEYRINPMCVDLETRKQLATGKLSLRTLREKGSHLSTSCKSKMHRTGNRPPGPTFHLQPHRNK